MVNKTLQSYLDELGKIYMDDILVYSNIKNQHVRHVKMVLDALKQKKIENQNRKMQVPCPGNNVFGIYHYSQENSDGNDQS